MTRKDSEQMAILVTGGAGFIGSHTCVELLGAGFEVVVADDFSNSSPAAISAIADLAGRDLAAYHVDVRDGAALARVFAAHRISTVIHFAAKKAVGESVEIPLEYFDVNVGGTATLVRAMREAGVDRLVFSSSCSIYGDQYPRPITEDDPPAPANPYARSKLMCEQILADACAADPALRVVSLRYFNPAGAHPSGRLGEFPRGVPGNVVPYLMKVAAGQLPRLAVFGGDYETPDGSAIRDYIHVMDVAEAHRVAVSRVGDAPGPRVLNLGTGTGVSVLGLISAFEAECGVTVPHEITGRRPGDVASLVADPRRAHRLWGWRASRDVRSMLADAWRFERANPAGYQETTSTRTGAAA